MPSGIMVMDAGVINVMKGGGIRIMDVGGIKVMDAGGNRVMGGIITLGTLPFQVCLIGCFSVSI